MNFINIIINFCVLYKLYNYKKGQQLEKNRYKIKENHKISQHIQFIPKPVYLNI